MGGHCYNVPRLDLLIDTKLIHSSNLPSLKRYPANNKCNNPQDYKVVVVPRYQICRLFDLVVMKEDPLTDMYKLSPLSHLYLSEQKLLVEERIK